MVAIYNIKEEMLNKSLDCCLAAFGSGLAWGEMFIRIGPLDYCEMIESDL